MTLEEQINVMMNDLEPEVRGCLLHNSKGYKTLETWIRLHLKEIAAAAVKEERERILKAVNKLDRYQGIIKVLDGGFVMLDQVTDIINNKQ